MCIIEHCSKCQEGGYFIKCDNKDCKGPTEKYIDLCKECKREEEEEKEYEESLYDSIPEVETMKTCIIERCSKCTWGCFLECDKECEKPIEKYVICKKCENKEREYEESLYD